MPCATTQKTNNILTRGFNTSRQTPTDPNQSSETVTATPTPPKEPGTSFFCQSSDFKNLDNSEGICGAAGGKFNLFSGVSSCQTQNTLDYMGKWLT